MKSEKYLLMLPAGKRKVAILEMFWEYFILLNKDCLQHKLFYKSLTDPREEKTNENSNHLLLPGRGKEILSSSSLYSSCFTCVSGVGVQTELCEGQAQGHRLTKD